MTVQFLVEVLRDALDAFIAKFTVGTATVTNGNTTATVTHGLNMASNYVSLTPTADPGGRYWVSNKTATAFQINLQTAAGVGGVSFDWLVKGA